MECKECGAEMMKVHDIKNTRLYICEECFTEHSEYITIECNHEYADKNGDKCIHCGE